MSALPGRARPGCRIRTRPRLARPRRSCARSRRRPSRMATSHGGRKRSGRPTMTGAARWCVRRTSGESRTSMRRMTLSLDRQCAAAKLELPVMEYRFAPPRRFRFDYCWPSRKLAAEVDGAVWTNGRHSAAAALSLIARRRTWRSRTDGECCGSPRTWWSTAARSTS